MVRIVLFALFVLSCELSYTQRIQDDFSDNLLSQIWIGDTDAFTINASAQLQLVDSEAGASILYAAFEPGDSTSWEFLMNMDFSPSSSNFLEVYLLSVSNDLPNSDAYFLRIGEDGSSDAVRFFKRVNGVETEIMGSMEGIAADQPNFRFRIIRKQDNSWSVSADLNGGFDFQNMFTFNDDEINTSTETFFGFWCNYTSSRSDKFYFDDVFVGKILPDVSAPEVVNIQVISSTELQLDFNEAMDSLSLSSAQWDWNGSYTGSTSFTGLNSNFSSIAIALDPPLTSPSQYEFSLSGAQDEAGNVMIPFSTDFEYIEFETAQAFDLIITEIMADPSPAIGLPDAEYIEIYNRSDKYFDLMDYSIVSGSSQSYFESYVLKPKEYLLLVDLNDQDLFTFVDNQLPVQSLIGLSNGGDDVSLLNDQGNLLYRVDYDKDWYQSSTRSEGGYSLEMKVLSNPCLGSDNWEACSNLIGGTPGSQNSVFSDSLIQDAPQIVSSFVPTQDSIYIEFDRAIRIPNPASLEIIPSLGIENVSSVANQPNFMVITVDPSITDGEIYTLRINENMEDCVGNASTFSQSIEFALPVRAEAQDLIINEILSDPYPDAADFVEIFNASDKVISLSDLALRNDLRDQTVLLNVSRSIFPGEYIVLTDGRNSVLDNYQVERPEWVVETEIPSFNNDEGNVQLGYVNLFALTLIDEVNYNVDMHYTFLDDTEGVSFEKINTQLSGLDRNNWHSAAASAGYGTPTARNSQAFDNQNSSDAELYMESNSFSPDQDGFEDVAILRYALSKPGFKAKVEIFSDEGRKVKSLVDGYTIGSSGSIKWSGLNEDNQMLPIGIYIFSVELVHPDGEVIEEQLPVVLSQKF